jgi:flagellar motility protein MotE (MotC chaperone)
MGSSVRLLPAVIAVSIGALAFKGVDIAYAFVDEAATDAASGEQAENPELTSTGEGADSEAPPAAGAPDGAALPVADALCTPATDYASEAGISEQEILVLRSLSDRRKVLEERETELVTREQAAAAAEERLNEQIAELKALEGKVQGVLAQIDAKGDERMAQLVKTYEAMKPKDAARIFDGMNDKVLLDLSKSMKPATLAAVMASMDPKRAEALTQMLAALSEPPASVDAIRKAAG